MALNRYRFSINGKEFIKMARSFSEAFAAASEAHPEANFSEISIVREAPESKAQLRKDHRGVHFMVGVTDELVVDRLREVVRDFGHLMEVNEAMSWTDLASRIRRTYDVDADPRILEAAVTCERLAA